MSSEDIAIRVKNLGKCYHIYDTPRDRLKQFVVPTLCRIFPPLRRFFSSATPNPQSFTQQPGDQPLNSPVFYREFWALKNVSFEVRKGEVLGIIGRNGAGKSTLLQILCGTLSPSHGSVETYGRVAALLELGAGFNPEFTGRENVYLNASVLGLSNEEIDARFEEIIAFADIGEFVEQPVKTYSSGMMVRLAFAVVAHVDANILIVDEALAVGDAFFTQKCMRFLRNFKKNGTILLVSHDTGSIKNLCDHAVWLEKGGIVEQGIPKEVCERYLEAFYEAQQGKSSTTKRREPGIFGAPLPVKDQRMVFINASNLRNDLQIFEFDPDAASFGKGWAQIQDVQLLDENGHPLAWLVGGERVTLRVNVYTYQDIASPVVGFFVKDRLGQVLFGDNTFLTYREQDISCAKEKKLQADFIFHMPILPMGDYSITVAVADSPDAETHVQHHWIHDALFFKSESSSVASGLIGIPMISIKLWQSSLPA